MKRHLVLDLASTSGLEDPEISSLGEAGIDELGEAFFDAYLDIYVTEGNEGAEGLFRKLGFADAEPKAGPGGGEDVE